MTLGHGTPFPSPKISFLLFSLFLSFVSSDKGEPGGGPNSAPRGDPPSAGERHRKSLILFLRMSICLCRGQNDLRTCVLNIFPSQQSKWHSRYPVRAEDVDLLVRKVEFPAHQDNPLYLLMFPGSKERQWDQTEEEIRWTIDGLLETVYREDETLYKACGEDGLPVGLIGWTTSPGTCAASVNGGSCDQNCSTVKPKARQGSKVMSRSGCSPPSLDVKSWLGISKTLREERQRVLRNCQGNGVCRITFMAVDPSCQRQGVGSTLMEMLCRIVDENALDAFVLSSPAGTLLYSRFGFKAVGVVETNQGSFTSMLRTSGSGLRETVALSS